jgi:hypothetical protein
MAWRRCRRHGSCPTDPRCRGAERIRATQMPQGRRPAELAKLAPCGPVRAVITRAVGAALVCLSTVLRER